MAREPEVLAEFRRALGKQLAAWRGSRGLRQSDIADATDLDRSTVAHIERGQARADGQFWQRVDELLHAGGELLEAYQELEAAKYQHEVRTQEQRLAALKAQVATDTDSREGKRSGGPAEAFLGGDGPSGNLPAELTSFVGRREEINDIRKLLATARLVTLTGTAGVGKSRLALRVADQVRQRFPDGVWLVELAPLRDASLVADSLVDALGIGEQSAEGPVERLTEHLRDRRALLVLDNCEHVLDSVVGLVERVLRAAPSLQMLATSREALAIAGEHRWVVSPLAVPDPQEPLPPDAVDRYPALALFAERAVAVRPGFAVAEDNRTTIARLCWRLDGLPLAIELAAAWLSTLSAEQIVARLDDRFRLLTSQRRAVALRHQTLQAAVEWSYRLCSPAEQLVWARASVFAGGFDLDAAEAVCSGDGIDAGDVCGLVAGLVDKSILLAEVRPEGSRYRLLETLRQFGLDRLRETGDEAASRNRHRDHYQRLVQQAKADLYSSSELEVIRRVRREHANLRAALDYCLTVRGEAQAGLAIATGLTGFWIVSGGGSLSEGRRWLDRALHSNPQLSAARAKGLVDRGFLAAIMREQGAGELLRQGRETAERVGDDATLTYTAHWSGVALFYQGDAAGTLALMDEALRRNRACGDVIGAARALYWMSLAATAIGDDRAVGFAEEALTVAEDYDAPWSRSWTLAAVGLARWYQLGQHAQATSLTRQAIRIKREVRDLWGIVHCVEQLAWIAGSDGRHEDAARLLGAARTVWRLNGMSTGQFGPFHTARAECERRAREALGDEAFEDAYAYGSQLGLDDTVTAALGEETSPLSAETADGQGTPLTHREWQVAELVADGLTNKDIAAALAIGQRTVEGYVARIHAKLGFTSRAQLAAWVARQHTV